MTRQRVARILGRPESLLVLTFGGLIAIGTSVLALPVSHAREPVSVLDAFFTATSAVCVTGLITRDTATDFTRTGQTAILLLIQLGGLGIMTFAAIAFQVLRRRLSMSSLAAVESMFYQDKLHGSLRRSVRRIVLMTLSIEAVGAVLIYWGQRAEDAAAASVFDAVFLSVSAFCNAGFSIHSDSLMRYVPGGIVLWTVMLLIILGGLGYAVLEEVGARLLARLRRRQPASVRVSLHTRIVLWSSGVLTLAGAAALYFTPLAPGDAALTTRLFHSLFQSVTARTAGFNTVDFATAPILSLMIIIPLMFVGGSPGSCAGGVKNTSVTVWLARVVARILGQNEVNVLARRIPHDVVRRSALVLAVAALWNGMGVMVLTATEGVSGLVPFEHIIFEQISAFGTVGLSAGITPALSPAGKMWIIASMFAGRVGPLTIALAVIPAARRSRFVYPQERVMVG